MALLFTMGLSVLTTVIFGFVPAWRRAHCTPAALKESPQTGASRGNLRLQNSVAIGEIALALVLLIAGSLLVRSFFAPVVDAVGLRSPRRICRTYRV